MKNFPFKIVPLKTEIAEAARQMAASGARNHVVVTADSPQGFPCRHCLHWAEAGERLILFPYAAIAPGYPYSETGPIFVHAQACERYQANEYPSDFRNDRVFRAYKSANEMIDATVGNGTVPEEVIENLFDNPETAFVHVRSVMRGCYTFAIERQ
jgi:uncharacterized protein DUF1203